MNELKVTLNLNCLVIIESLVNPDTTLNIYNRIIMSTANTGIKVIYEKVHDGKELIDVLDRILNTPGMLPLIHFAMHGDSDGFQLINDKIKWGRVVEKLKLINIKSRNGLPLIMALCYGVQSFFEFKQVELSSFGLMIAPQSKIKESYLDGLLFAFYEELLRSFDFTSAINTMTYLSDKGTLPFIILTPHYIIDRQRKFLHEEIRNGKARHRLLTLCKRDEDGSIPYEVKQKLQYPEDIKALYSSIWNDWIKKFLMLDRFPEISKYTYTPSFDDSSEI